MSRFKGWTEKTARELRQNVSEADGIGVDRDEGCLAGGGGRGPQLVVMLRCISCQFGLDAHSSPRMVGTDGEKLIGEFPQHILDVMRLN